MKYLKLFFLLLVIIAAASCKKDYDCECTDEFGNYYISGAGTYKIKHVSKKEAKRTCATMTEPFYRTCELR